MSRLRAPLALALLLSAAPITAMAQPAPVAASAAPANFVTEHSGTFNGQRLRYKAVVGETPVTDDKGQPLATFVSTAYLRQDGPNLAQRPVLFLFNGGPGSASMWLHLGAFGPRRVALPADVASDVAPPYRLIDNPYTILDVADLVFIDPPGTGYSRLAPGADPKSLWTAATDAQATADCIQAWTVAHHRGASPRYVMGESYGTIRAVLTAEDLSRTQPLNGVILLGQATNMIETSQRAGNIVGLAANLPVLASIAWYHGKVDHAGHTQAAFLDEVYAFAMGDYLTALAQGRDLPDDRRHAIADKLAAYTGLPADYYLANALSISKERFRREILKDRGLVTGQYDARYTATPEAAAKGDPSMKIAPAFNALIDPYLQGELGVKPDALYKPSDPDIDAWDYGAPPSPFSDYDYPGKLARVMAAQPTFKLMIGSGLYDTTTTFGVARYLVARSAFPIDRTTLKTYDGGHMAYTNEAALKALTGDVRTFVSGH
jgi:carboxypeptidase C (cathepsin A)